MISLTEATLGYDNHTVLDSVSLKLERGERIVLLGQSGSGKTTLLNHIYQQAVEAALVPQALGLVENLSAYHNVYMGRLHCYSSLYNLINLLRPFAARLQEVRSVLEMLGLDEKILTPVTQLSGGQRQRIAVARALYHGSELLLADEPVSALDGPKADQVLQLLSHHFSTSVITLHDVERALAFGSRVIVLQNGEVVLDQPTDRLSVQVLDSFY